MKVLNYFSVISLILYFSCHTVTNNEVPYNLGKHIALYKSIVYFDSDANTYIAIDSPDSKYPNVCYFFDEKQKLKSFLFMLSLEQYRVRQDYDTNGKLFHTVGTPFLTQYYYENIKDTIDFVSYFYSLKKRFSRVTIIKDNNIIVKELSKTYFFSNSKCYKIQLPLSDLKNSFKFIQKYSVFDSTSKDELNFVDTIRYKPNDFMVLSPP